MSKRMIRLPRTEMAMLRILRAIKKRMRSDLSIVAGSAALVSQDVGQYSARDFMASIDAYNGVCQRIDDLEFQGRGLSEPHAGRAR